MKRLFTCCFTIKDSKTPLHQTNSKILEEIMENPSRRSDENGLQIENMAEKSNSGSNDFRNIILNHDFSGGLDLWHANSCDAFVATSESIHPDGTPAKLGYFPYAVVTNRKKCWHGLEQDITSRVTPGSTYKVSAQVGVSGISQGSIEVQATLKLEFQNSETTYLSIGRKPVQEDCWETLEGTFLLTTMPYQVIFYLEGPSPGVNLLIKSATASCTSPRESDASAGLDKRKDESIISNPSNASNGFQYKNLVGKSNSSSNHGNNIILNHDFSGGMHLWHPNGCGAFVVTSESSHPDGVRELGYIPYAVVTNRKESWQGLEQDITSRVNIGSTYTVSAKVGVSGTFHGSSDVQATLKLEYQNSNPSYLFIGRKPVPKNCWEMLEGTFSLSTAPSRVVFYLEGPSPGVELLIKSVTVSCTSSPEFDKGCTASDPPSEENIILNPKFEDGISNWSGRGCKVALHDSMADGKILPMAGTKVFASATERTQSWNGIQQEITGRMQRKLAYEVTAMVRIFGNNISSADVRATLWVQAPDHREQYIGIANVQATDKDWVQLQGKVLLNGSPSKVVIYLEGPPSGTDILLNSLIVKHAAKAPPSQPPVIENEAYGINIIANSNLNDGTNGWFPLGNCTLSSRAGSPHIIPPMARDSLGIHEPLSGRFIHVTNRTQTWMGPAQMISEKVKLYMTYQVSAWVRIGPGSTSPQNVNIALGVDNQWVNGGQVEVSDDRWHEIGGSFRIEKQPSKVMVYVQGPAAGIDLMVGGLQIFPVDRHLRIRHLKRQADKVMCLS
ncbi:hypothetical protein Leryth_005399 [Lithospermum erythrorhizon]|nr:hypothetical protein Leryth_005399 [Lithospermum erythrorhizon]